MFTTPLLGTKFLSMRRTIQGYRRWLGRKWVAGEGGRRKKRYAEAEIIDDFTRVSL
jgi:hypothetical protein